jgi:hypothetical protein
MKSQAFDEWLSHVTDDHSKEMVKSSLWGKIKKTFGVVVNWVHRVQASVVEWTGSCLRGSFSTRIVMLHRMKA